jgi:hypothetical protein
MAAEMERVGRNEPCPCGSKKKYKHCHQSRAQGLTPLQRILYAAIAAAVVGGLYLAISSRAEPGTRSTGVWSAEHGHYH